MKFTQFDKPRPQLAQRKRDKIYLRAQHSPDYAIFRTINQPRCKCCGKGAA